MISTLGAAVVAGALGVELAGRRGQFMAAIHAAPIWILSLVVLLQLVALIARTEAWHVCVRATGATVGRRPLFRAAGVGYLASLINGSLGVAARIAALRRTAPDDSPHVPALLAAEVPIISVEIALTAVFSFTLIGPLGVPWWVPVIAVAVAGAGVLGLRRLSNRRQHGIWSGLAVMRSHRGRMIAFVLLAICAQIGRNWLVLRGIGVHVSLLDAIALLIAMFTLGQLPIGPTLGPAAAVLILGSHGVATVAAAGVLLTITSTVGSLCYAAWALADRFGDRRPALGPEPVDSPEVVVTAIPA
ncbi:MAG: lysylphosphatidylglycerol synthase domain-containing protein [Solirubrobacteraceae bacterium]